jgi:hypothetical protein
MSFREEHSDIPIAKCSEKKANLAEDEKIRCFWDTLVDEWLKFDAACENDSQRN